MSQKSQEAFAKVENLRSQFPNETNTQLIERAGVNKVAFYKGQKMAKGNVANTTVSSGAQAKRGRPAKAASTRRGRKPGSTSQTAQVPHRARSGQMFCIVGSAAEIRSFIAGQGA